MEMVRNVYFDNVSSFEILYILQADCEISIAHFQSEEQIIKPAERAKLMRNKAQPAST
jgi:hypothetical protein